MMSTAPPLILTRDQASRLQVYLQTYRRYAFASLLPGTDRNTTLRILQTMQCKLIDVIDQKIALFLLVLSVEEMTTLRISTTYDLTDALGSVVLSFSASAIQGEQLYGPYGNQRYIEGTLGTDKGYTGQFTDSVTGLDYYNARWYDPVSGQFVSPDSVQGNAQGSDPYAYVSGNPETKTDPTGQRNCAPTSDGGIECGKPGGGGGGTYCYSGDCSGGGRGSGDCSGGTKASASMCGSGGSSDLCPSGMRPGRGGCVYSNGTCAGLTIHGCDVGKQRQADALNQLKHIVGWLTMAIGLGSAIFDILAAIQDFKDGVILQAIGDILNSLGDIVTFIAGLATVLNSNGLAIIASFASTGLHLLSGFYQLAINTGWGLQLLAGAAGTFVKLFFAANPTSLLIDIGSAILYQLLTKNLRGGLKGGFSEIMQGAAGAIQGSIDTISNESIAQYCAGTCN